MSETMNEHEFEKLAYAELDRLMNAVSDVGEEIDPDLASGVLNIHFDDDTTYVVNSHRAAKQIWMAAERAAWHFDYLADKDAWIASRTGDELWSTLSAVLGRKLGSPVELSR